MISADTAFELFFPKHDALERLREIRIIKLF